MRKNRVNVPHRDVNASEFLVSSPAQAGSVRPPIDDSLICKQPSGYWLNTGEAYDLLKNRAVALQQAVFGVLVPACWTRQGANTRPGIRPRVRPTRPAWLETALFTAMAVNCLTP